ncbi:tetratricopeptide repeat protein, partial [Escherichia coli]|uniref:tetratricopeptide repeat protein n=2 Tax=Pseudomonadota TaxID=1224 RepID=UPI0015F4CD1A
LKNFEAALADFDRATALQPNYALAHHNRGNALSGLARYEDALAAYQRAVALMPGLIDSWAAIGLSLQKLERHE